MAFPRLVLLPIKNEENITRFREKLEETPNGMPLHYPRFTKAEYEDMPKWKVDLL